MRSVEVAAVISIHVPRVEDDAESAEKTASAAQISIHVPRVEDDSNLCV